MRLIEGIRMAMRSLGANKMRASLTMLGIIIGTGAVIALLSVGQGAQAAITEQIQGIGSNLIFVLPGQLEQAMGHPTTSRAAAPLTVQDAQAIMQPGRADHVAAVAPEVSRSGNITYNGQSINTSISCSTPAYEYVRNFHPALGRFFTTSEDDTAARVVVLGSQAAEVLFDDPQLALGETVRINRVPFTVVGVLQSKGGQGFGGGSRDNIAIVPLNTALKRLYSGRFTSANGERVDLLNVSAVDDKSIDAAMDEITWVLRDRHDIQFEEDDFTVASQEDILGVLGQITSILTIFLGAIAGISLLVGGIGIMNIMLVSVTERTREIGIRKAVGAKRRDILWQFLMESITLSVFGGAVGIAFGWGVSRIINTFDVFTTIVTPQAVMLAVGFSVAVGLFFGIYPASRASNLHPIQALRYE